MDFSLTGEQLDLGRAALDAFLRFPPRVESHGADGSTEQLAKEGWFGLGVREESGGSGLGLVEQCLALEAAGQVLHGGYWAWVMLGVVPLSRCGAAPELVSELAEGKRRAVLALYDGSDAFRPLHVETRAEPTIDGYRLFGHKKMVPMAAQTDLILCPALMDGKLAVFAVPAQRVRSLANTSLPDLLRPYADVELNGVLVERASLIAEGEAAVSLVSEAARLATLGLCAELVGAADTVLAKTVRYVQEREQFGVPVGRFQAVKHRCAEMKITLECARSALYYAAWAAEVRDADADRAVSVLKAYCSHEMPELMAHALHLHGGMGFTWEAELHLYFRRALVNAAYLGTASWHRRRLVTRLAHSDAKEGDYDAAGAMVAER